MDKLNFHQKVLQASQEKRNEFFEKIQVQICWVRNPGKKYFLFAELLKKPGVYS